MMTLFLTTVALAAVQPAAETRCELKDVPATDLIALRVAMLDQVVNGTARPAATETTLNTIEKKAAACDPASGTAADKAAAEIAVSRLAAESIGEKLAADGVDMAKVDAIVKETDKPVLESFVAKKFDAKGVDAFGERVTGAAGKDATPAMRKLLGAYAFNAARVALAPPPSPPRSNER